MRDIRELLTEKESELERVRKEIQSLHAVIPLLEDERPGFEPDRKPVSSAQVAGAASSGEDSKSSFWGWVTIYAAALPARTWCTEEFSTGSVCTVGAPCITGPSLAATSWKSPLS